MLRHSASQRHRVGDSFLPHPILRQDRTTLAHTSVSQTLLSRCSQEPSTRNAGLRITCDSVFYTPKSVLTVASAGFFRLVAAMSASSQAKHVSESPKAALLVIDMQNDFCPPNGSLAVTGGNEVVPIINNLKALQDHWEVVVLTQDWHPQDHVSFFSNHQGNPNARIFEPIRLANGELQMMWPDHCVIGSKGARLHPNLKVIRVEK